MSWLSAFSGLYQTVSPLYAYEPGFSCRVALALALAIHRSRAVSRVANCF